MVSSPNTSAVSLFPSELGWFALVGFKAGLVRVTFGHPTRSAALAAVQDTGTKLVEQDWNPKLRQQCEAFATGKHARFPRIHIVRQRPLTEFQQKVVEIVQAIPAGETLTYGQVAELAGSPGAARAVGQVMANNPVPLVIPCHRVVGSAGGLGGFSAPGGIETKRRLLKVEGRQTAIVR